MLPEKKRVCSHVLKFSFWRLTSNVSKLSVLENISVTIVALKKATPLLLEMWENFQGFTYLIPERWRYTFISICKNPRTGTITFCSVVPIRAINVYGVFGRSRNSGNVSCDISSACWGTLVWMPFHGYSYFQCNVTKQDIPSSGGNSCRASQ